MNKLIVLSMALIPTIVFAQEAPTYIMTGAGIFFMIFAWTSIIIWNAVCFTKILSKKKN